MPEPIRPTKNEPMQLVWDLPIRIFHWVLTIAILVSIITAKIGGLDAMELHVYCGCLVLSLIVFRLIWGLVGTDYARFSNFVKGPTKVVDYLRQFILQKPGHSTGHNPAGGWMVLLMLGALLLQASSGLFVTDDIFTEGPLAHLITGDQQSILSQIHSFGEYLVPTLVLVHLAAIMLHRLKGEHLTLAMVHGKKHATTGITSNKLPLAALLFGSSGLLVYLLVTLP